MPGPQTSKHYCLHALLNLRALGGLTNELARLNSRGRLTTQWSKNKGDPKGVNSNQGAREELTAGARADEKVETTYSWDRKWSRIVVSTKGVLWCLWWEAVRALWTCHSCAQHAVIFSAQNAQEDRVWGSSHAALVFFTSPFINLCSSNDTGGFYSFY